MTTSPSPCTDFDFLFGHWTVAHRRLHKRLAGCDTWDSFSGSCHALPLLAGNGNVDDNLLHLPGGSYRAASLRAYDAATGLWAIWWLDGRSPAQIDVPVKGRFDGGVGSFFADETIDGRPVRVRFLWTRTGSASPRWEQAFSADGGARWETNWEMDFRRADVAQPLSPPR